MEILTLFFFLDVNFLRGYVYIISKPPPTAPVAYWSRVPGYRSKGPGSIPSATSCYEK
jgi:hypothetical protein